MAVECWLNDRLRRDPLIHVCDEIDALLPGSDTQLAPYFLERRALHNLGIARHQLVELGLESAQIDRLYRALFVYSNGILELLSTITPEASKRVWKVYWTIVDGANDQKSESAMREVKNDFMLRLLEFHDRQLRMTSDTAQQKQDWEKQVKALVDRIESREATISQMEITISQQQQRADVQNRAIAAERLHNVELTQQMGTWKSRMAQSVTDLDRLRRDKAETDAMIGVVTLKRYRATPIPQAVPTHSADRKKLEDQLADHEKRFVEMDFTQRTLAQEKARFERRAEETLGALQSAQAAHRADLGRINDMTHQHHLQDRIIMQLQAELAHTTRRLTIESTLHQALDQVGLAPQPPVESH